MKKSSMLNLFLNQEINKNRKKLLVFMFLFISGLLFGTIFITFFSSYQDLEESIESFISAYSLQETTKNRVFFLSIYQYLKFSFFLWISGWSTWFYPLCFTQVFFKGFRLGYTVSGIIKIYQFPGVLFSALTLFPQNIIFLPALFFYATQQVLFYRERKRILREGHSVSSKKDLYRKNIFYTLLFLVIILISAFIEGYITPILIKILCPIMK